MTQCSSCGQCCEVLAFSMTKDEAAASTLDARTRRWFADKLVPITHREAARRAPWWPFDALLLDSIGRPYMGPPMFYRCSNYDTDTRLCADYENRPEVCRTFPLYGDDRPHPSTNLPPRCSFRADLGQPIEEWAPVELRRTR
jgi:Fe-S-cluster containining protein